MNRTGKLALISAMALTLIVNSPESYAWNPPPGSTSDHVNVPATGVLSAAHGYITQTGVSLLYNDGYWFAAQAIQPWEQHILDGVRYADVYQGYQRVVLNICAPAILHLYCETVYSPGGAQWPLAADNHYFNPDTGYGLQPPASLYAFATWAPLVSILFSHSILQYVFFGTIDFVATVEPHLAERYGSALDLFDAKYSLAIRAQPPVSEPDANGRTGMARAAFFLGWASHLMQDLNVVHHTFDQPQKHHSEYESAADGLVTERPVADGASKGLYLDQLPAVGCTAGSRRCFPAYAAHSSHDATILNLADSGMYVVAAAIARAQSLQAGLYASFVGDITGQKPVHMSALVPALIPN